MIALAVLMAWVAMIAATFLTGFQAPMEMAKIIYVRLETTTPVAGWNWGLEAIWQVFCVALPEESLCLSAFALQPVFEHRFKGWGELITASVSRGIWSALHIIRNPQYMAMPMLAVGAFFAGLALYYWGLKKTQSLPAVAVAHGLGVNTAVYMLGGGGA